MVPTISLVPFASIFTPSVLVSYATKDPSDEICNPRPSNSLLYSSTSLSSLLYLTSDSEMSEYFFTIGSHPTLKLLLYPEFLLKTVKKLKPAWLGKLSIIGSRVVFRGLFDKSIGFSR